MDGPAGAPHQRRLDKVMAQDMTAERLAAAQFWKTRVLREGAHSNDGVMAPVVAFGAVPPGDPGRDQRSVKSPGKLLQPRKQRSGIDHDRERLNKGDAGMPLHR